MSSSTDLEELGQLTSPMSPVEVEHRLRQCVSRLAKAEKALRDARDEETNAEIVYRQAHRRAMFSGDCPKVTRGGYTTAERDAWVDEQCANEWRAYRLAIAKREAAADHVRISRDIAVTVQSIGALVRQAFSMAGHT